MLGTTRWLRYGEKSVSRESTETLRFSENRLAIGPICSGTRTGPATIPTQGFWVSHVAMVLAARMIARYGGAVTV